MRRQATLDEVKNEMLRSHRVIFLEKEEITGRLAFEKWELTGVDAVGVDNNLTLLRLPKQFCQTYRGYDFTP